ncbi:pirin family protein [Sphingomonas sp. SUN019]|uniref:pirin family protein n=1 Tax=Sphingomonas sp. SUN019 TaxID=2937788 RepID=UPI002164AE03|nr:pirin family protein [Sphingomonas sp. SUN019]UVO49909.1 pirin family protein [Sphingomonas sp. SUN019]
MSQAERGRTVARIVQREAATEGAGVSINRVMPIAALDTVDPFLLLDEIRSDDPGAYLAGFPPHPHRGIETITYMLAGRMHHRDSTGGNGVIGAGDVQWMTAARGIIHSEMPEQSDGLMWGFQLWLNMPAAEKMATRSSYLELATDAIPTVEGYRHRVRVISGAYGGKSGPAPERTVSPTYLDVAIDAGGSFAIDLPDGHSAFAYVFDGEARIAGTAIPNGGTAILSGDGPVSIASNAGGRLLLIAGRPLREPVFRAGPFAMASARDLEQAFEDLRSGRFLEPA